jgi:hypothetical protein
MPGLDPDPGAATIKKAYDPGTVAWRTANGFTVPATVNEKQTITPTAVTAGNAKLNFSGEITANIVWNATAAAIKTALENLSNIDVGDILVTGGPLNSTPVVVEFTGPKGGGNMPQMTVDNTGLTGTLAVTTTQAGSS